MERLWTPWRSEYVTRADEGSDRCPFCDPEPDLLLAKTDLVVVILNLFPYNTGHTMVAPNRHVGDLMELTTDERREMFDSMCRVVYALQTAMNPHGFNTGMNLGGAAGAGLPGHLHMHVVPRWGGDTNFMPVTAGTKVLPETLDQTSAKLRPLLGS